jgi:hypothetical protein
MSTTRFSRRSLIRGLGAAAAGLPFLSSFEALAGGGGGPQPKLIFFFSPNSCLVGPRGTAQYEGWLPRALHDGTGEAEAPLPASLPEILSPLERHRDVLLPIDGLRGVPMVGSHQQAACLLTGTGVFADEIARAEGGDGEWYSQSISVDQRIAERIGSRVLGMSFNIEGFNLGEGYVSHLGPNMGFTPIQNPVDAFERVFGMAGATSSERLDRYSRQRSVLDLIGRDTASLQRRLPAGDRVRLDAHLSAVRSIETDLMAPSSCGGDGVAPGSYDARAEENIPRLMQDYSRIMAQGMACGYTRVGFVQVGNLGGQLRPRWPELDCVSDYRDHAINHKFGGEAGAGSDGLSMDTAIPLGVNLQKAYNTFLATLLDELAATPDVDGSPMLDHTIVVHCKQMGENHDKNRLFWVMAGGRALGVRGGRALRLGAESHYVNDLHVALARKMGVMDMESFGTASLNRTPLDLG